MFGLYSQYYIAILISVLENNTTFVFKSLHTILCHVPVRPIYLGFIQKFYYSIGCIILLIANILIVNNIAEYVVFKFFAKFLATVVTSVTVNASISTVFIWQFVAFAFSAITFTVSRTFLEITLLYYILYNIVTINQSK